MVWKALLGIGLAAGAAKIALDVAEKVAEEEEEERSRLRAQRLLEIENAGTNRQLALDDFEDEGTEHFFETKEEAEAAAQRLNKLSRDTFDSDLADFKAASKLTDLTIELSEYGGKPEAIIHCAGTLAPGVSMELICVPHQHGQGGLVYGWYDEFELAHREEREVGYFTEPQFDETLTWAVTPGDRLRFKVRFVTWDLRRDFDYDEDSQTGLYVVFDRRNFEREGAANRGERVRSTFGEEERRLTVPFFSESTQQPDEVVEADMVEAFFDHLKARLDAVIEEEKVTELAEKTITDYIAHLEAEGRPVSKDLRAELARVGQTMLEQRARGKGPWAK